MTPSQIIGAVDLFSDIYEVDMYIVAECRRCRKINPVMEIARRISLGKIDFRCKKCDYIDRIHISILGNKIPFMTKDQIDTLLRIFGGTYFEYSLDIVVNRLLYYGTTRTNLRRKDVMIKLATHFKEGPLTILATESLVNITGTNAFFINDIKRMINGKV